MNRKRSRGDDLARRRANRILAALVLFLAVSIGVDLLTKGRRNRLAGPPAPHEQAQAESTTNSTNVPEAPSDEPTETEPPLWSGEPRLGDLDMMIEKRRIRALVPFSKTFYFLDGPRQRGLTYDSLMLFEAFVNQRLAAGQPPVRVVVVPTPAERLLSDLVAGRGDLAAGSLAVSPEHRRLVDFAEPLFAQVDEIVVTAADQPAPANLFGLAGREVLVRASSPSLAALQELNHSLRTLGKALVRVSPAAKYLEDEDLLEMVNAGLAPMIVVDGHKARFWQQVFTGLRLHPGVKPRRDREISWALRKESPELRALLDDFMAENRATGPGDMPANRYLAGAAQLGNPLAADGREKFALVAEPLQRQAQRHDLDWPLLAALAFQESGLDHGKRGPDGAMGIMQIRPAMTRDSDLVADAIEEPEGNIQAGAGYLRSLIDRYFADPAIDALNRQLFALAAYHADPDGIARLRVEATTRGLDPNQWFNNVEIIAAGRIGREIVRYVGVVYLYSLAYERDAATPPGAEASRP